MIRYAARVVRSKWGAPNLSRERLKVAPGQDLAIAQPTLMERFPVDVRHKVMSRRWSLLSWMIVLVAVSYSSQDGVQGDGSFVAPTPPDEFASGLTIGFIPEGFAWVWDEGHETATFHVFQTEDGSQQLSVGVQQPPPLQTDSGETLSVEGRDFVVNDSGSEARVAEGVGGDIRLDMVSFSLDAETLLRTAENDTFNPTLT